MGQVLAMPLLTPPDPERQREELTRELDDVIARLKALLGPNAMVALVGGRIARAAHLHLREHP